jgi:hypothetical protein
MGSRAVTAQRTCRRLMLSDDGVIDLVAVKIAARGARPVVTSTVRPRRRRRRKSRATAARQALSLYEADLLRLTWDRGDMPQGSCGRPRARVVTTRAALRAAGVPPDLAAALRRRLRLIPEEETGR